MSSMVKLVSREFLKGFNGPVRRLKKAVRLLKMRPMTKNHRWPPEATHCSYCLTTDLKKYKYRNMNLKSKYK